MGKTKIALAGAGFISHIHMESYMRFVPDAEIVAVYSRSEASASAFAEQYNISAWYTDYGQMLKETNCEIVDICLPNFLHHKATLKAAESGRHVIIEKPLCVTLKEADEMIEACKNAGVKLMYAEELCFAPKYERVKSLVNEEGAVGKVYMIKQSEKHSGPHSDWFYDVSQSGGGVLMDMGCHAVAWMRWILGGSPRVVSVYATMQSVLHSNRSRGEDNTVMVLEFEDDVIGVAEDSWARHGGMDDKIEIYGDGGVTYADLFMGNSTLTYSLEGYGYVAEKAGTSKGWTFTMFEEAFNQGYPHELLHFIDCIRNNKQPKVTGEDGRAVLEILYAAYASAGEGKKIHLPFHSDKEVPVDLWRKENIKKKDPII
ncbi:MAG: Gfo/Idh/MocA family oxidoreductase [Spirochaetia bacterium]|nr:Gfo/Idh/MocA family oxidoreductase [Spirochaetia bacterium]